MNASAAGQPTLYPISVEGRWGFIDPAGSVVIQPQFLSVGDFSEELARVTVPGLTEEDRLFERNASGFIDERGTFVIGPGAPPGYQLPEDRNHYSYGEFHDGLARFWVGDSTGFGGYIVRTGKLAIPPRYADVNDFSQGLACVSLPRRDGSAFGPKLAGFIDCMGEFAIPPDREFVALGFSEGRCVISLQDDENDWHASVIDLQGKTVIPPYIYTGISDFVGGVSRVVKDGKVGCINIEGEIVVPLEFDQLWEFEHNNLTTGEKDGRKFIVDRTGRCVRQLTLGDDLALGRLRYGLATVESQEKVGYVNSEGELAIPMRFDRGGEFRGELARVELAGFKGYINQQGDFVWKTDRWDEPIHNSVRKPLSDFLPPNTVASLPLEYNWQSVANAIVFATNEPVDSLQPWFTKEFGRRFELHEENNEQGQFDISVFGDAFSGSFHAVDVNSPNADGFVEFYSSENMDQLMEQYKPAALGIIIQNR